METAQPLLCRGWGAGGLGRPAPPAAILCQVCQVGPRRPSLLAAVLRGLGGRRPRPGCPLCSGDGPRDTTVLVIGMGWTARPGPLSLSGLCAGPRQGPRRLDSVGGNGSPVMGTGSTQQPPTHRNHHGRARPLPARAGSDRNAVAEATLETHFRSEAAALLAASGRWRWGSGSAALTVSP